MFPNLVVIISVYCCLRLLEMPLTRYERKSPIGITIGVGIAALIGVGIIAIFCLLTVAAGTSRVPESPF